MYDLNYDCMRKYTKKDIFFLVVGIVGIVVGLAALAKSSIILNISFSQASREYPLIDPFEIFLLEDIGTDPVNLSED